MKNTQKKQRAIYLFTSGMLLVTTLIIILFYVLYSTAKRNLVTLWSNNAIQMSKEVEYYLTKPQNAITFTSKKVEEMIKKGASNEEIRQFLINETGVYSVIIESNTTGIYGYCQGEYLDGSGWDVPDDYIATERPWYISAKEAGGAITFVKPFYNLQTGAMMMSVSKLLNDGESVISMDIYLDSIQQLEKNMTQSDKVDAAMVIDKSGTVVAHSISTEIGKDYSTSESNYEQGLLRSISDTENGIFAYPGPAGNSLIFCEKINNEWYSVLILNEKNVLGPLKYLYLISACVLVGILIVISGIFVSYVRANKEADDLEKEVKAISDIYSVMVLMDLHKGTIKSVRASTESIDIIGNGKMISYERTDELAESLAAESSRAMLKQFMNLKTLDERMGDLKTISHEYVDTNGKWNRMHFIVVSRGVQNKIRTFIWAIQSIDEDRKRQEELKQLAETDALTHILNRNGGESRIFELLEKNKPGMMLILDADHFKHVNDTYGHDMGDKVIIGLANCLKESFRDTDVVYRMGGDEFVAFASGVEDEKIGQMVIDRLFKNIDNVTFDGINDWKLCISVGAVFCNNTNKEPFAVLYKTMDQAMYESKQHTGNYATFGKITDNNL